MNESNQQAREITCRHCREPLALKFLDLGFSPPSNDYLNPADLNVREIYYPLRLFVCEACWLVQTQDFAAADELFRDDYAYFSSVSTSWQRHAKDYVDMIVARQGLDGSNLVVEIASNDGYLLRHFVEREIPCLGIEPTMATAQAARDLGVETLTEFFTESFAGEIRQRKSAADLVVGNNVFAHVPDILDFARGIERILNDDGIVTLEFPHLLELIANNQFDTVYHEHFSYLSLLSVSSIFANAGLRVFDVSKLTTHGGSLRIFGCKQHSVHETTAAVAELLQTERRFGLAERAVYEGFQQQAIRIKHDLLEFLLSARAQGKKVVAYGAAAKGNTLLNYAGVRDDLLLGVCDAAPSKQGKYLPGSHLEIHPPAWIHEIKPDYVLVLPWNILDEIETRLAHVRDWGAHFVTAIPSIKVF